MPREWRTRPRNGSSETDDIEEFAKAVIEEGDYVLNQTPEMLPVLKQAGVVDSGGQGLMQVVKGAFDGLTGKMYRFSLDEEQASKSCIRDKAGSDRQRRFQNGY